MTDQPDWLDSHPGHHAEMLWAYNGTTRISRLEAPYLSVQMFPESQPTRNGGRLGRIELQDGQRRTTRVVLVAEMFRIELVYPAGGGDG